MTRRKLQTARRGRRAPFVPPPACPVPPVHRSTLLGTTSVPAPGGDAVRQTLLPAAPAPVRLALPRYTQAPSTMTALKCTRGQIFS